jgi:hypothetical protein
MKRRNFQIQSRNAHHSPATFKFFATFFKLYIILAVHSMWLISTNCICYCIPIYPVGRTKIPGREWDIEPRSHWSYCLNMSRLKRLRKCYLCLSLLDRHFHVSSRNQFNIFTWREPTCITIWRKNCALERMKATIFRECYWEASERL